MVIKRWEKFLESDREDYKEELLEYFTDLEDEFLVDIQIKDNSETPKHFWVKVVTPSEFKLVDFHNLISIIRGIISMMMSMGRFHLVPPSTIEGRVGIWKHFNYSDIQDKNLWINSLRRDGILNGYSENVSSIGICIWLNFVKIVNRYDNRI